MQNTNDYFKTAEQYNREVKTWTLKVRGISINILASKTHSSGALQKQFHARMRMDKEKIYVSALGFIFNRYGAFRAYGAGRGYVVENGVIRRGRRVWTDEELRNQYRKKGEKDKDIRKMKIFQDYGLILRSPLNWLDAPIEKNINDLADIAGEYHGDEALRNVLKQIDKITIKKNYGER